MPRPRRRKRPIHGLRKEKGGSLSLLSIDICLPLKYQYVVLVFYDGNVSGPTKEQERRTLNPPFSHRSLTVRRTRPGLDPVHVKGLVGVPPFPRKTVIRIPDSRQKVPSVERTEGSLSRGSGPETRRGLHKHPECRRGSVPRRYGYRRNGSVGSGVRPDLLLLYLSLRTGNGRNSRDPVKQRLPYLPYLEGDFCPNKGWHVYIHLCVCVGFEEEREPVPHTTHVTLRPVHKESRSPE